MNATVTGYPCSLWLVCFSSATSEQQGDMAIAWKPLANFGWREAKECGHPKRLREVETHMSKQYCWE